jgi:hypothetical protein
VEEHLRTLETRVAQLEGKVDLLVRWIMEHSRVLTDEP